MYQNWGDADCIAGGHGDGYWFIRDPTFSLTLVNGRCGLGAELIGQFPDWDTLQGREREAYRADSANLQLRYREFIGADRTIPRRRYRGRMGGDGLALQRV